ncbi:hypothetical protein N7493_011048 [Penicillium malachiteum]|uniref:Uncharacterized protein n=1 Tax=Penicillium malachiteum TaxID=1324776 RepID=A0AAD6MQX2_9EURO|nr:hypothetical protein N7493_011048 [Penicillium malachiteum]
MSKLSDANPCPGRGGPRECMNQRRSPSHHRDAGPSSTVTEATGRGRQQDASARHMHGAKLREKPRNHDHRTHPVLQGHTHHLSRERAGPAPKPAHHSHAATCSLHGIPQSEEEIVHRNESLHGNHQQQPRWVYGPPLPVVMVEHRAAMKGRRAH